LAATRRPIYNREKEHAALITLTEAKPGPVNIIVRPENTGKTHVLRNFVSLRQERYPRGTSLIDGRLDSFVRPSRLANTLLWKTLLDLCTPAVLKLLASEGSTTIDLWDKVQELARNRGAAEPAISDYLQARHGDTQELLEDVLQDLQYILQLYEAALKAWHTAREVDLQSQLSSNISTSTAYPTWPLLIIDFAQLIMEDWSRTATQKQQQELLLFLTRISAQQQLSHVLLVTADSTFPLWFEEHRPGESKTHVFGDLTEGQARGLVDWNLQQYGTWGEGPISDEAWKELYAVCSLVGCYYIRCAWSYSEYCHTKTACST
jgi:hypothetical protein